MGGLDLASVIVVNWNGRRFLADCLAALERQTVARHRYEILLIDNGSTDDSVTFVRTHFPGVRVSAVGKNLGFTGANNLGFRLARGRYVVLLNNDTVVAPGWLAGLIAAADVDRSIGGVASRLMFRDKPGVVNSTGLVLYRDGRGGDRHLREPDGPKVREPVEVFGGCGASLLLKRELLDDIGGFDPDLFMYYEDLDLCWRARLRGWRFVYAPASVALHVCGGSTVPASPLLTRQTERNRVLVAFRNAPAFLAIAAAIGIALRAARLGFRFLAARNRYALTPGHLRAMASAIASVVCHLPAALLDRYSRRIEGRRVPDRIVTRFMERRPPVRLAA